MDPADPQNSMLTPVIAGRCILLGSNSGLLFLSKLVLSSITECLHAVDRAWHPSHIRSDLSATDQTDHDTGADDESKDESVFAVCRSDRVSMLGLKDLQ